MEGRKWEELLPDCLVKIFEGVGLESLISHVPLVCKSWYKTSLYPYCWKNLDFRSKPRTPFDFQSVVLSNFANLIKFSVSRSCGCATRIILPRQCTVEVLSCIAVGCPNLKSFCVTFKLSQIECDILAGCIRNWKHLEVLILDDTCDLLTDILLEVSIHCKNFIGVRIGRAALIEEFKLPREALCMLSLMPKIIYLKLSCSASLNLRVSDNSYVDYDPDINEIMNFSSPIKTFKLKEFELVCVDDCLLPASVVPLYRQIVQRYGTLYTPNISGDAIFVEGFLILFTIITFLPQCEVSDAKWEAWETVLAISEECGLNVAWFRKIFNAARVEFSKTREEVVKLLSEMDATRKTVKELEDLECQRKEELALHHLAIQEEFKVSDYCVFKFSRVRSAVEQEHPAKLRRYNILEAKLREPVITSAMVLSASVSGAS
ncbi:hypothetical protein GIB67_014692 [Kingdonia uniflora]|uniref:F-box domain-containing protein n=1 Tax=Kingdonia uniflora TaxID=39325 RepID=A0A7J7L4Q0_9MAGN|nr:hypothetical protein GIB67_014692 [Kingdonia uniflora]